MKKYIIYLKSHCEAPDFEATIEANSKEEALTKFKKAYRELNDFEDAILLENISLAVELNEQTPHDLTALDLKVVLRNARQQETYLSLDEIAKAIQDVLYENELKILSKKLLEK